MSRLTTRSTVVRCRHTMALALAAGAAGGLAGVSLANPTGQQVVAGSATFAQQGATTTITASNNAIINYQTFNIAQGETVRFVQPTAASRVLNRIQSNAPSTINGNLQANGIVYLVNRSGIMFGANSVVNVGGLYAAAGNIANDDFLNSIDHFTNVQGTIRMDGSISAQSAAIVARQITNNGAINADGGWIVMAAGNDVLLRQENSRMYVRLDGRDAETQTQGTRNSAAKASDPASIRNTGSISADDGHISMAAGDMLGLALLNQGVINAHGGTVDMIATHGTVINAGTIDVGVGPGQAGDVSIHGVFVTNSGRVRADAESGHAGNIELVSTKGTTLTNGSLVASNGGNGVADGGTILIDSTQGRTVVEKQARLDISGGKAGGHGGSMEISAATTMSLKGILIGDTLAGYAAARLVIDPAIVIIALEQPDTMPSDSAFVSVASIEGFQGDTTILADNDIFVLSSIHKDVGGLTLLAGNDIQFCGYEPDPTCPGRWRPRIKNWCTTPNPCGPTGGSCDITISADYLDFQAGHSILDMTSTGAILEATTGDIHLLATTGRAEFGLASVAPQRIVSITQAESRVIRGGTDSFLEDPENTHLVVNITNGSLTFAPQSNGTRVPQSYYRLDASAKGDLTVDAQLESATDILLTAGKDLIINDNIHATDDAVLHGGAGGAGIVVWCRTGLDVWGTDIALIAGDGNGTSSFIQAQEFHPMFRGGGGGDTRPDSFTFRQDAAVTSALLPLGSQFGASTLGMIYNIESVNASVKLSDANQVTGTILTISSLTGTSINDNLSLTSLEVFGSTALAGDVASTGTQTYHGPVTVDGDRTLTASTVTLDSTLDGTSGGDADRLTIDADLVANGQIGGNSPLEELTITRSTVLGTDLVRTEGDQTYGGHLTLTQNTTLESLTGTVAFGAGLDAATGAIVDLDVIGNMRADGPIGQTNPLNTLDVTGASTLNGGLVRTTGEQSYGGPVVLGADTLIESTTGATLTFNGSIDGNGTGPAEALTLHGSAVLNGQVGATDPLAALSIDGPAAINTDLIRTLGDQTYAGPVLFSGDARLESAGGRIAFESTVDSASADSPIDLAIDGDLLAMGLIGGTNPLNSLSVAGDAELCGGLVRTVGTQLYSGDVVLCTDTILESTTGATLTFNGAIDGDGLGDAESLTLLGEAVLNGPVGASDPLAALTVTGPTSIAGGLVRTIGTQTYNLDITINGDTTLASTSGAVITLNGPVNGNADGTPDVLTIDGSVVANGAIGTNDPLAALSINGPAVLNAGTVDTIGDQTFAGALTLGTDTTLTTQGGLVTLGGPVDSASAGTPVALAINSDAMIEGAVGATNPLQSLAIAGNAELCGGLVRTVAGQLYSGDVILCVNTILESTTGDTIEFGGTVDGNSDGSPESLTINGALIASGAIGASDALASLVVNGPASLAAGLIRTIADQDYFGPTTVAGDMTFESTGDALIRFRDALTADTAGTPSDVTVAANAQFDGRVGDNPFNSLTVEGNALIAGGSVTTIADQRYNADTVIADDTTLMAFSGATIRFGGTLDSANADGSADAHDLFVGTGPGGVIRFAGDVGSNGAFDTIQLCTQFSIAARGESSEGGEILPPVPTVPDRATIVGEQSLTINTADFIMCPYEKFTTLGSLTLNASRLAELGDLVTIAEMTVNAPSIVLLTRPAADLQLADGTTVTDRGLDFVAGGQMNFNGTVTTRSAFGGTDPAPTFEDVDGLAPASLAGFEFNTTPVGDATMDALVLNGVVLDQRTRKSIVPPPPPPPVDPRVSDDLASITTQPPAFVDSIIPEVYDLSILKSLAINARGVEFDEALNAAKGSRLYIDNLRPGPDGNADTRISATRLSDNAVRLTAQGKDSVSGYDQTPEGVLVARPFSAVGDSIAEAFSRFTQARIADTNAAAPSTAELVPAFRDFLVASPDETQTLNSIRRLAAVLDRVRSMGLPTAQYERTRRELLAEVARQNSLGVDELIQLVESMSGQV
ncbi:MAG: filamentous hemagglutinin N-terminal domain-containing protein [Phycisphaerales bacterium]|nr:MAG: filamentous hemagglutinin N-terminal domain-containing protein [Phycisphaerales bacterium]